jgi:hypothetical protein
MLKSRGPLTHERAGRILAGVSLVIPVVLALTVSPWWLLAVAGVGLNLIVSGITDRCLVKDALIRMGLPGEREVGRAEAAQDGSAEVQQVFRRVIWRPRVPVN